MRMVPHRAGLGWLMAALLSLVARGETGSSPTPTPSDQLIIVTATPGVLRHTPPPTTERRYEVREGDTLSAIALRFDVSEAALQRVNTLDNPDTLVVGQELVIPPPES
jgi:LysM repeat protein